MRNSVELHEVDRLDIGQLTFESKYGNITGRVAGAVAGKFVAIDNGSPASPVRVTQESLDVGTLFVGEGAR